MARAGRWRCCNPLSTLAHTPSTLITTLPAAHPNSAAWEDKASAAAKDPAEEDGRSPWRRLLALVVCLALALGLGLILLAVVLLLNTLVAGLRRWGEARHGRPAAADGLVGVQS